MAERFQDVGTRLESFAGAVDVVCPACGERALVRALAEGLPSSVPHRLTCASCGAVTERERGTAVMGAPVDPAFGLPLWLQTEVVGHRLWALNGDHVELVRRFVAAERRGRRGLEGAPASLVERLPPWLKAASNRREVLDALERLSAQGFRPSM